MVFLLGYLLFGVPYTVLVLLLVSCFSTFVSPLSPLCCVFLFVVLAIDFLLNQNTPAVAI